MKKHGRCLGVYLLMLGLVGCHVNMHRVPQSAFPANEYKNSAFTAPTHVYRPPYPAYLWPSWSAAEDEGLHPQANSNQRAGIYNSHGYGSYGRRG